MPGWRTRPSFLGPQEVCQSTNQSDNSFESYRTYRRRQQINSVVKTIFSHPGCLTTSIFYENFKNNFSHETNTFSYYVNVKIIKGSFYIFVL